MNDVQHFAPRNCAMFANKLYHLQALAMSQSSRLRNYHIEPCIPRQIVMLATFTNEISDHHDQYSKLDAAVWISLFGI